MAVLVNQQSNGYELLRQLTLEFSIRSRAEALSLRTQIAGRSFVLTAAQTSPSSLVSDVNRRIDYEAARFSRLLGALPMHVDMTGLRLADSDLLVVLLKSLPETVKNYTLHHSSADTYESYRNSAMRWEEQQRLFNDFDTSGKKVHSLAQEDDTSYGAEYYSQSYDGEWGVNSLQGRCTRCGSRKHEKESCTVDMSKVRCFRCGPGTFGHVSQNCTVRPAQYGTGKGNENEKPGMVKSDMWDKKGFKGSKGSKGMKGGKGKKGKMNEVFEDWTDWSVESWDNQDLWWHDAWTVWYDGSWDISQTQWSGDGSEWYGYAWTQQEPAKSAEASGSQSNAPEAMNVGSMIISTLVTDLS